MKLLAERFYSEVPLFHHDPQQGPVPHRRAEFTDGMPSQETLDKVYDHLDFTHAFEAFVNTVQGVGFQATHMGLLRRRREG